MAESFSPVLTAYTLPLMRLSSWMTFGNDFQNGALLESVTNESRGRR